jgi:HEAT repeat protein
MQQASGQLVTPNPEERKTPGLWLHAPPELQAERFDTMSQAELIALLKNPGSSEFEKAHAMMRLRQIGTAEAVPAVAPFLSDLRMSVYARNVLESMEDAASTEALRSALSTAQGEPLVGVINSLARRKDRASVPAFIKTLYASNPMVAEASAWALGRISGLEAANALEGALSKTTGRLRDTVAASALASAEGLTAEGQRDRAMALYNRLDEPDIPKAVRLGAMTMTIAAETEMTRPR